MSISKYQRERNKIKAERLAIHYGLGPHSIVRLSERLFRYSIGWRNVHSGVHGDGSLYYSPPFATREEATQNVLPLGKCIYRIHEYRKPFGVGK